MKKINILFVLLLTALLTACIGRKLEMPESQKEYNEFDFSTVSENISFDVQYSNTGVDAPVYFEVYDSCPVENGSESGNYVKKEGLLPIFTSFTDAKGKYSGQVSLPSYVEKLYFYAPQFYARTLLTANVVDGAVSVSDDASASDIEVKATTDKPYYSYMADNLTDNQTKGRPVNYKDFEGNYWRCWLGEYDEYADGAIRYACTDTELLPKNVGDKFLTFHEAINSVDTRTLLNTEDFYMAEAGKLVLTFLGSNTSFNNSLGYYYYAEGQKPETVQKANVIMVFPNTQDGLWEKASKGSHNDAAATAGMTRNTSVKLMYYPNIAKGSTEGATDVFPKGTRIGLVLATNAFSHRVKFWGYRDDKDKKNRSATTPGFTVNNEGIVTEDSRTLAFRIDEDVFVGFEEYEDDKNYTDCVLTLNSFPSNALHTAITLESDALQLKSESVNGVYAFEDLWPYQGDYDLNDVIVRYNHETIYSKNMKVGESFILKTYENGAGNENGLGVSVIFNQDKGLNTFGSMNCTIKEAGSEVFKPLEMVYEPKNADGNQGRPIFLVTDNVKKDMGAEYKLSFTYNTPVGVSAEKPLTMDIKPFIYRDLGNGKRVEVHITNDKPTFRFDTSLLGTGSDASVPSKQTYFVRAGNYPFAIYLAGATVDDISELLKRENEMRPIDQVYPAYSLWVSSNGKNNQYWYKSTEAQ